MLTIHLTVEELRIAWANAKKACIGGVSRIRTGDRQAKLMEDQLVGQIGNMAGCKWWYGNIADYIVTRKRANANPTKGDGGSDLTGIALDFKCSLMRAAKQPERYNLIVRPAERHTNSIYVLVLLPHLDYEQMKQGLDVHVVGWLSDQELSLEPESDGVFSGAYVVGAKKLHPAIERVLDKNLNDRVQTTNDDSDTCSLKH